MNCFDWRNDSITLALEENGSGEGQTEGEVGIWGAGGIAQARDDRALGRGAPPTEQLPWGS